MARRPIWHAGSRECVRIAPAIAELPLAAADAGNLNCSSEPVRSELLRLGRSVRTVPPAGQTTRKQADGRDRKRIVIFVGVIRDRRAAREATVNRVGHLRRTGSRGPWLHDS
jgi:hypothetical protein